MMNLNLQLSEEELRALLGSQQDEPADGAELTRSSLEKPMLPSMPQEAMLLHALKAVVKTLTVRVASLESELGRLHAELAAARHGSELPPAEERIVVEAVTLPVLPAERELAAAADNGAAAAGDVPAADVVGGTFSSAGETKASLAQPHQAGVAHAALTPRSARHRKPKKKNLFSRLFD